MVDVSALGVNTGGWWSDDSRNAPYNARKLFIVGFRLCLPVATQWRRRGVERVCRGGDGGLNGIALVLMCREGQGWVGRPGQGWGGEEADRGW